MSFRRLTLVWTVACGFAVHFGAASAEDLLVVNQPTREAEFGSASSEGALTFHTEQGPLLIAPVDLIRWSHPSPPRATIEAHLTDGSRLCLAEGWSGGAPFTADGETARVETRLFGRIELPRSAIRGVLWRLPSDATRRFAAADRLFDAGPQSADRLRLINDDLLEGQLQSASPQRVVIASTLGLVEIAASRVAAIALHHPIAGADQPAEAPRLIVGLRDGSRLVAERITANAKRLEIVLASGVTLSGGDRRDVVFLQTIGGRASYLSDCKPTGYRHIPYLEIPWQHANDRNVLGGPLVADRYRYEKGLGMHSASRLTYDLDGSAQRFAATVAVDDSAIGKPSASGSVVFRAYLRRNGRWQAEYESPTIRGGDPPETVSVELADAEQLSIMVDYADRGDERDYANWLDARLE